MNSTRMKCSIVFIFSISLISIYDTSDVSSYLFNQNSIENHTKFQAIYCSNSMERQSVQSAFETVINSSVVENASKVFDLRIGGCDIDFVMSNLKTYGQLKTLDISGSKITSNAFRIKHDHLQKLNISHNNLTEIASNFFADVPELTEIDLSHNNLVRLNSTCFNHADKLTTIHLSNNSISEIDEKAFVDMESLKFIDLSGNSMTHIEFSVHQSVHPKTIRLENNRIEAVDCSVFRLIKNETNVYLSWAYVIEMDTSCLADQFTVTSNSINEGVLHGLKNEIQLHCNESSFESILHLKIGHKQIKNGTELMSCLGTSLETIDLSGNSLDHLDVISFQKFTHLKKLRLSDTEISHFDFAMLTNCKTLQRLDISRNKFKTVENVSDLKNLKLKAINLAGNHLKHTEDVVRLINPRLQLLDVSGNNLDKCDFNQLENVQVLRIRSSNSRKLDVNQFKSLEKLHTLDISFNDLKSFNSASISKTLPNLRVFRAVGCQLHNLMGLLRSIASSSLWALDLSGNVLGELASGVFDGFNLKKLSLSNASLSNFDVNSLGRMSQLTFLDISNNALKSVPNLNSEFTKLMWLNLAGNNFNEIHGFSRSHFPNLSTLNVAHNNLSCELLLQLKREWTNLKLIGFDEQMHQQICVDTPPLMRNDKIGHHVNAYDDGHQVDASDTLGTSLVTAGVSIAVGIIIASIVFVLRKRLFKSTKQSSYVEPAVMYIRDRPAHDFDDHIYEEIDFPHVDTYDHLEFGNHPVPIKDTNGHYHNDQLCQKDPEEPNEEHMQSDDCEQSDVYDQNELYDHIDILYQIRRHGHNYCPDKFDRAGRKNLESNLDKNVVTIIDSS